MLTLNNFDPEVFLRDYWQKKPLLIRQAFPGYESPIAPDELAGLACEEGIEARLALEKHGEYPWQVKHGPFKEEDFADLPESHWSLLVQAVDRQVPEVADLLDAFQFVPSWRVDDIMISFAPAQGSVGAHTDSYDVFILQAWGRRRWEVSSQYDPALIPDLDMKILQQFKAEQSWELEPGDLLYIPPGVAHHGVALEDCMNFSVGFLAPTRNELIQNYFDETSNKLQDDQRYADPDLKQPEHCGEIPLETLQQVRDWVRSLPQDDRSIDQWFGAYISEPRLGIRNELPDPPYEPLEWIDAFTEQGFLRRDCRLLFIREGRKATLFADGQSLPLSAELAFAAPLLSEHRDFSVEMLAPYLIQPEFVCLLADLCNKGLFYLYSEEED